MYPNAKKILPTMKINVTKEIQELKNQLSYSKNVGFFYQDCSLIF
jgi:hypothetical protein